MNSNLLGLLCFTVFFIATSPFIVVGILGIDMTEGVVADKGESTHVESYKFMSISHTNAIRGILMLIIILYHESLFLDIDLMPREGAYAVMLFFFLSGYGLYLSSSKPNYLRDFVQKKIIGLILRYWIIEVFFVSMVAILYLSSNGFIDNLIDIPFSTPHWYVFQLLFFYISFYFAFLAFKNKRNSTLLLCVIIPLIMYMQFRYFDSNLYLRSGLGFVFGLIFARYKDYFDRMPIIMKIIVIAIAGCILYFNEGYSYKFNVYATPIFFLIMIIAMSSIEFRWLSVILVVMGAIIYSFGSITCGTAIILVGLCEFTYTGAFFSRIGKYSLEVYLIHYLFLTYFYEKSGITDPLWLFIAVAVVATIVSIIIKTVSDFILDRYNARVVKVGNNGE